MEDSPPELLQSNSQSIPLLNIDVLDTVSTFLTEYPDLLSLSLTSSVYHPLAIRTLLRTRPVVLNKLATILKFHDFLFIDATTRTPHLVALVIDVADDEKNPDTEDSEGPVEALAAILRQASSLKSLELLSSVSGRPLGYLDDLRLSAAVGELASLRELTIEGHAEVADFIGAVRSPLTKLTLSYLKPAGGLDTWTPTSLSSSLSSFHDSLESLSIEASNVQLDKGTLWSPVST